jgi:hypothetical protein
MSNCVNNYTFNDWQYTVSYNSQTKTAELTGLVENGKNMEIGPGYAEVKAKWNETTINLLEYEDPGDKCTNAISYVLQVVLQEATKADEYPWIGRMSFSDYKAKARLQCYKKAFESIKFYITRTSSKKIANLINDKKEEETDPLIQQEVLFFSLSQSTIHNKKKKDPVASREIRQHVDVNVNLKF